VWALRRFKQGDSRDSDRPFFSGAIASDVIQELGSEGFGLSLHGDAIDAIRDAAMAGDLRCRGVDPYSSKSVDIEAAEWAHLEVSAEGEVFGVVKSGRKSVQISRRPRWESVVVEGRQLRRLFPRSSGKGGTRASFTSGKKRRPSGVWMPSNAIRRSAGPLRRAWFTIARMFGYSRPGPLRCGAPS
jgi:hypothetical protein